MNGIWISTIVDHGLYNSQQHNNLELIEHSLSRVSIGLASDN